MASIDIIEKLVHKRLIKWYKKLLQPPVGVNGEYGDYVEYVFDRPVLFLGWKLVVTNVDTANNETITANITVEFENETKYAYIDLCDLSACYRERTISRIADLTEEGELGMVKRIRVRAKSNLATTNATVKLHVIYSG